MFNYKFPAIKGIQAGKEYYIAMVPLGYLSKLFPDNSDVVAPEFRAQRRINEFRIPEIKNYILENRSSYVFSALSASIDGQFKFIPVEKQSDLGTLEIDMNSVFLINDGQHRKASLQAAIEEDPTLANETISIVFFKDAGLARSQQMFTDLNKHAVKTSNSLSTLYDQRDRLAIITRNIIDRIPFFKSLTDKEKDNLGKNSSKLFTLTNIYKANQKMVGVNEVQEADEEFLYKYWKELSEHVVEWKEVQSRQITKKDLRENYIVTLGVLILAFGRLGSYFYQNQQIKIDLSKFDQVDWERTNKLWLGRCIREDGHISNSDEAVLLTANALKKILSIPLSKDEQVKEQKLRGSK